MQLYFAAPATQTSHDKPAQLKQSVQLCLIAPVAQKHHDKSAEGRLCLYRRHSTLDLLSAAVKDMQVLGT